VTTYTPTLYRFPEQLRFKHLSRHEMFFFPAGNGTPMMGPYIKLSARRYVPVRIETRGLKYVPHINGSDRVIHVGSVNAIVSDRIQDLPGML